MDSEQSEIRVRKRHFSRWGYFILIASTFLVTPIAGLLIYRESQLAGLAEIGDPFDVDSFTSTTLPNEQNAAPDYRLAISLVLKPRVQFGNKEPNLSMAKAWIGASENVRQWVIDNQPALAALRLGSAKPDSIGLADYAIVLPGNLADLRELCRIASVDISRIATEQDHSKTWEAHVALIRFGRHVGRRGILVARLTGDAICGVGFANASEWIATTSLDEGLLRKALSDVVASGQLMSSAEETLQTEYVLTSKLLQADFDSGLDFSSRISFFLKHEPELSRRVLQHDAATEFARLHSTPPGANVLTGSDLDRFAKNAVVARTIRDSAGHLESAIQRETADQHSIELFLAAHIYRRTHGQFPSDISQVSEILTNSGAKQPVDPFSRSGDFLKFRIGEDRFVVWSIGENEIDDGGQEGGDRVLGLDEAPE